MIEILLLSLGLVLIIEGIGSALFPNRWQHYLLELTDQPTADLRNIGFFILTLGAIVVWLSQ
tara:strand:- start:22738 stop:22923 length:186 start_codon:yes stop_codon:yes gene_type:complete